MRVSRILLGIPCVQERHLSSERVATPELGQVPSIVEGHSGAIPFAYGVMQKTALFMMSTVVVQGEKQLGVCTPMNVTYSAYMVDSPSVNASAWLRATLQGIPTTSHVERAP